VAEHTPADPLTHLRDHSKAGRGLTPSEVARLLRISPDRVRAMIARGELGAVNTSPNRCGRCRYVVLPHHLAEWERSRQVVPPPKTPPRRRRPGRIDHFPDY
jgi:excisionase family DNA binding protein